LYKLELSLGSTERKYHFESDLVLLFVVLFYTQVFSGYRFLLRGKELGLPAAIVNIGPTRCDSSVDVKITARIGEILPLIKFIA
jgi:hypothetical protein